MFPYPGHFFFAETIGVKQFDHFKFKPAICDTIMFEPDLPLKHIK